MVHHSYMFEKVYASDNDDDNDSLTLREKCPNTEFLLVRISHIRNEYVSLRIHSECGKIRTRKNSPFGHFLSSGS